MKTFKRALKGTIAALVVASVCLLVGCSTNTPASTNTNTDTSANNQTSTDNQTSATGDTMADRTITDMAGRQVTVPGVGALKKIYYTGATAEIYCYSLAPELAGGTTFHFTADELAYLPADVANLPYLGTVSGGQQLNLEAIDAADIQLIIDSPFAAPTASDITDADDLQQQTGIPVVLIDGTLNDSAATYSFLGSLLGKETQAQQLAAYCDQTLTAVNAAVAKVPADQQISLYYAEGSDGLQTEPTSSSHAEAFVTAGAQIVAQVPEGAAIGMSSVSLEQVINWDPDVIIATSTDAGGAADSIRTDSAWASIAAVQNGRVYTMPNAPYAWCDRPPGVNRLLGIQWVANMLYPTYYHVDMVQVTEQFYSLFYHVNITDAQAQDLLGNSYPVYQQ